MTTIVLLCYRMTSSVQCPGGTMEIRKFFTAIEDIIAEAGQCAPEPLRKVAVVAIIKNPYAGKYEPDLKPLVDASADLARRMTTLAVKAMEGRRIESYGKGAVVGLHGEQEHGVALITTAFGNVVRDGAGGGRAWISSMTKRAAPGVTIDIPLAHKDALYVRSHYDGMSITLHDAPLPNEIAVVCCYANRARLNHRVGGLAHDQIVGQDGLT